MRGRETTKEDGASEKERKKERRRVIDPKSLAGRLDALDQPQPKNKPDLFSISLSAQRASSRIERAQTHRTHNDQHSTLTNCCEFLPCPSPLALPHSVFVLFADTAHGWPIALKIYRRTPETETPERVDDDKITKNTYKRRITREVF